MAVISVEQTRVSVRQNETTKQLTIIATVFLPLAFVTGFFGQNFGWLVDHVDAAWAFVVFGLGGLLVPCIALWAGLRRSGSVSGAGRPHTGALGDGTVASNRHAR